MRPLTTILLAVGLVLAGCSSSSEPTAIYNGTGCVYDGPAEFDLNSTVTFTVTNESETTEVGFGVWKFPSGTTSGEILDQGIFQATGPEDDFYEGAWPPTQIGTPYEITVTFDTPGQNGINCFDQSGDDHDGDGLDHVTMFTVNE